MCVARTRLFCYRSYRVWKVGDLSRATSVCFDYPCDSSPSSLVPCVIVISPLVSLMSDQVYKLKSVGITSVAQLPEELPHAESKITHLFASPEALIESSRWRKLLLENDDFVNNILAIVVDEAHCIVKW